MLSINLKSPTEVMRELARKAKARRLAANLTQEGLAHRADVSLGTLKLFEREGKASLETVLRIAFVLDAAPEFDFLFPAAKVMSIVDVQDKRARQRGRRT
jgi:transcriptional regulator with XRE-family HTH domain